SWRTERPIAVERQHGHPLVHSRIENQLDRPNSAEDLDRVANQRPVIRIQYAVHARGATGGRWTLIEYDRHLRDVGLHDLLALDQPVPVDQHVGDHRAMRIGRLLKALRVDALRIAKPGTVPDDDDVPLGG